MATPWYAYPLDSPGGGYQEMTDPMGPYLKPDTNIAIPAGTPITTWDSGTITSVIDRGRTLAGLSVTERLDHPPNSQAQYASFNYLGSSTVQVGQRVQPGQQVGVAGSPYGVNFALGLGVSPTWGAQCPQCTSKQPSLDPRLILNALRAGSGIPTGASANITSQGQAQINAQNSFGALPFGIGNAIVSLQQSLVNMLQEIGIFLIALVIIILGVMLLWGKQITGFVEGSAQKGAKAAEVAAVA